MKKFDTNNPLHAKAFIQACKLKGVTLNVHEDELSPDELVKVAKMLEETIENQERPQA